MCSPRIRASASAVSPTMHPSSVRPCLLCAPPTDKGRGQLAALNAQGGARPMWLNGGFFRANGGCGCVCVSSSLRRLVFGKGVELQSDAQFRSAAAAA